MSASSVKLCLHSGAETIERDAIAAVATPPATKTWHPVPHNLLVSTAESSFETSSLAGREASRRPYLDHLQRRLVYENAMLEAEGGKAAELEIEPGGWIGGRQIVSVNKSPVTGRAVSVKVRVRVKQYTKESGYTEQVEREALRNMNIERLGQDAYKPPTDAEREQFAAEKKQRKAATPTVSTINPTDDDAEQLQQHLNRLAAASAADRGRNPSAPRPVERMTQAKFSQYLKHEYVSISTQTIDGQEGTSVETQIVTIQGVH